MIEREHKRGVGTKLAETHRNTFRRVDERMGICTRAADRERRSFLHEQQGEAAIGVLRDVVEAMASGQAVTVAPVPP